MNVDMRNSEGYLDLTAYEAIKKSAPVVRSGPSSTFVLPTLEASQKT